MEFASLPNPVYNLTSKLARVKVSFSGIIGESVVFRLTAVAGIVLLIWLMVLWANG